MKLSLSADSKDTFDKLINMLAWMELCGSIGHSTKFSTFFDGDGHARIKLEFETQEEQQAYDSMRKEILAMRNAGEIKEPLSFNFD